MFSTSAELAMIWSKVGEEFESFLTDWRIFKHNVYIASVYEKPSVRAVGLRGDWHRVMMAMGDRSKESDRRLSCQRMVHLRSVRQARHAS